MTFSPGQRRRNVRVVTDFEAPAFLFEQAHPFVARVLDLSVGGVLIQADRRLPLGGAVRLRLQAAEPKLDVTVLGSVVRHCPERSDTVYGLRFGPLPQATQMKILRYVLCEVRRATAPAAGGEHPAASEEHAPQQEQPVAAAAPRLGFHSAL
jgi:c-di-GMP-binding flagellar brake protein YcgR